jgi:hypothetical protein
LQGIYGTFSGVFSGSGPLSLEGNGINRADLSLTGNNSGFGGTMSVLDSAADGGVVFGAQANVPGGAAGVIAIAANGRVRFGGATFANDVSFGGNAAFTVAANQVATLTGSLTGGANNLTVQGAGVLCLAPAGGESVTGSGSITVAAGALQAASTAALFTGNLNLNGGVLILDGRGTGGGGTLSFAELTAARTYGTGSNQWRITVGASGSGGFAARSVDVPVTVSASWVTNFTFGCAAVVSGARYADKSVVITNDFALPNVTVNWRMLGTNRLDALSGIWRVDTGAPQKITGRITGGGALGRINVLGSGAQGWGAGGVLRLSNANNDFTAMVKVGGSGANDPMAILLGTSDGAFGNAANRYDVGQDWGTGWVASGLMLEDTNAAGPTVFTRTFRLLGVGEEDTQPRIGHVFGAWAGDVAFRGTLLFTNTVTAGKLVGHTFFRPMPGTSLWLGTNAAPATLNFASAGNQRQHYYLYKQGAGELAIGQLAYQKQAALTNAY